MQMHVNSFGMKIISFDVVLVVSRPHVCTHHFFAGELIMLP